MNFRILIVLLLSSISSLGRAYEMEDIARIEFKILDPDSRELVFEGYEVQSEEAAQSRKQTYYYDLKKNQVYIEDAFFDKATLRVAAYNSLNHLSGEETVVKTEGEQARVRFRPSASESPKEKLLPWGKEGFHTKVITQLILRNWAQIVGGRPYKFDLLLPFRFESLGFQLVNNKRVTVEGEERQSFLLQPQNFIIRAFVPRMEFQFSVGPKPRVKLYRGPSPLPVHGETNKPLDMVFEYPGAKDS